MNFALSIKSKQSYHESIPKLAKNSSCHLTWGKSRQKWVVSTLVCALLFNCKWKVNENPLVI